MARCGHCAAIGGEIIDHDILRHAIGGLGHSRDQSRYAVVASAIMELGFFGHHAKLVSVLRDPRFLRSIISLELRFGMLRGARFHALESTRRGHAEPIKITVALGLRYAESRQT